MISRKRLGLLSVGLLLASLAVSTPAVADNSGTLPAGCSISPSTPSLSGSRVVFGGSARCGGASSADFRLVHNYNGLPDSRVTNVNQRNNGTGNFSYAGTTCDGGGTTQYYSEIRLYVSGSPQRVSNTVTLNHC